MAVWITGVLRAHNDKLKLLETFKINLVMPEDAAIISSKSDVDPARTAKMTH